MKTKLKKIWNTPITGAQLYLLAFAIYFIPAFLILYILIILVGPSCVC